MTEIHNIHSHGRFISQQGNAHHAGQTPNVSS